MNNHAKLDHLNYKEIKSEEFNLAILPWGATEAHNFHLPYGTDNFETGIIAAQSAHLANEKGARAIVLPTIPFGVNTGQTDIPLVINMNPSTQKKIIDDVIASLHRSGINKLLILNGHGGNDFKSILREAGLPYPDMCLCSCNWFQVLNHHQYFGHPGDHADEMETSLMLYIYPELVLPLKEAGNGQAKKFAVPGLNEKWAWSERKWTQITNDTGVGNPLGASAEKGEKFFKDVCHQLSQFIYDLASTPMDRFYKY
ncbi:creatininase family protein [Marinilabiliaceae bacterium JC017]|nr:creatininase family protein [Marinilabiliaceae bacterium JC017]